MGRPRLFNYEDALMKAMSVFWAKGYDGASMRDLTSAMGITGPSLYSAFGDKRELFLKTIDHYRDAEGCAPLVAFESTEDIGDAIRGFLIEIIHDATEHESGARGCFLASSVVTMVDLVDGVGERVDCAIEETENRLAARFDLEIEKGNLPRDFPSRERASLLFDMRQGYMFRGRAGWSSELMKRDLESRVQMLLTC